MKQTMKRLVTFCLAVAMMLSLFPAMTAKAATKTENLTLYVGEAIYVTNYYDDSLIVEIEDAISKLIEEKFSGKAIFLSGKCKELIMKAEL